MKIYFDGCSWTQGTELENQEEERYSKLICNHLGAEENNLGYGGGSNDRIVRNLLVENNIEKYDAAFIQMTFPARTEYLNYDSNLISKWIKVSPKWKFTRWLHEDSKDGKGDDNFQYYTNINVPITDGHAKFWRHYYTRVANLRYFQTKEKIHLETIRNTCKAKGVPLVLSTINNFSNLEFDYVMIQKKATSAPKGHPNKFGHQIIANDLLKKYENLL
tara:strand:+ start:3028 stop:3681 length:654 start_codon:yes stop_codon:yes gene_type:complete